MVRTARRVRGLFEEEEEWEEETVMARMASATASSSREGSKKMLSDTAMTRRVIGGSGDVVFSRLVLVGCG